MKRTRRRTTLATPYRTLEVVAVITIIAGLVLLTIAAWDQQLAIAALNAQ